MVLDVVVMGRSPPMLEVEGGGGGERGEDKIGF